MNNPAIRGALIAAVMAACMASPVFAAAPKTESVITHDKITLGDVFDGVTENTDYYLAPAPAAGKTVTLNAHDLTRISEAFNLGWVPASDLDHAVIRRSSSVVDRFDIQAAVQLKLAEKMKGQKFDMEMGDRFASFRVPEAADRTLKVEDLTYDAVKGMFRAVVSLAGAPEMKKEVSGRLYQISQLPVLKTPLRPGDIIAAGDIDYIDIHATDITASMVTEAARLVGQTPRHGIAALRPVTAGDLQLPVIIKKGDVVTMVLKSGVIDLTARGSALESGSAGDAIRVMNTSSKQIVEAVVTGAQTVDIKSPLNAL